MNRKSTFSLGEYYHIYNRGVEKRSIFEERCDRERFLTSLYFLNSSKPVVLRSVKNKKFSEVDRGENIIALGAYCLMPNHFHLLVKEIKEGGISCFMEKLGTGYVQYFNKRYDRVGPLFQGTFKAEHVSHDEYLKYLFAYIHLNPVKLIDPKWKESDIRDQARAKRYLQSYRYSSYLDHTGVKREEGLILRNDEFPKYFLSNQEFEDFLEDWLTFNPKQ